MKITLIHSKYFNSWEALGLGYIGAYIKKHEPTLSVSFFQGCFDEEEEIISGCQDADIVAFSCTTPTFPYTQTLAKAIKKINPKVRTVVGGYHPSATPESCLVEGIDHVVSGEGESAMLEIIRGKKEKSVQGKPMKFDELPWPDRELIRNERNIQVAYNDNKKRITSFQSHRACPFMCRYCLDGFYKVLYERVRKAPVSYRGVVDLLDEIDSTVEKYNLDLIKFSDPTWNTDIQWVIDFCKEKIRRKSTIPFYPNMHASVCSEEMIALMAEAGCYEIALGVESGSPKILRQIGKGTSVRTILRAVKWAQKYGLVVRGYFILGMPDESEEDLRMTEELADELNLDEYGFSILCPYPGTEMYDQEKYKDVDWAKADEYSNDFWKTRHVTNQQLKDWQKYLTNKFKEKLTWHNRAIGHGVE
jgi:anaerobic magnesium-protoporphyrin IX monomethyl ester cyclase